MDPAALIPHPDTIPAPWWLFELLGGVTLTLHLLLINVAVGGSMLILVALFRGRYPKAADDSGFEPASKVPTVFALAINLGVAPLLFMQVTYGHLIYSSSVLMAVWWLAVIPALILAYYGAYVIKDAKRRVFLLKLVSPVTVLLLLGIAFVYVNNMTLMVRPDGWNAYFENRDGTLLNLADPVLWPRYFHFVFASVAVAGLFVALGQAWRARRAAESTSDPVRPGLRIFAWATLGQVGIGFWFLVALPKEVMMLFMGQSMAHTLLLLLGLGLGVGCLLTAFLNKLWPTTALLMVTLLVMVTMRALVRAGYLAQYFTPTELKESIQMSPLLAFFAVFVAGGVTLVWLLRKAARAVREGAVQ